MRPTPSVTIRPATLADLPELERLENSVFPGDRLSRRSLRYYVGAETACFLVLLVDEAVGGDAIVAFRRGSKTVRLYSLAIRGDLAGRGLGRHLLTACETTVRTHGRELLRLEVRDDNHAAIGLYRSAGYREFGHYPDYYEDGAAALRFEKRLTDRADDVTDPSVTATRSSC